jgi:integrase
MPRKLPPHVYRQITRHGKSVFYFRIGKGKRIRLPNPDDKKSFEEAYRVALIGGIPIAVKTVHEGTLQWLWDRYTTESAKWAGYSEATRKQQRLIMAKILGGDSEANIKPCGHFHLSTFTQDVIQAAVDRRHETPAAAANYLKTMKGMFAWGRKMRAVAVDPTIGVDLPEYKTSGFAAWTVDDVTAFRAHHKEGTHERLAMELMLLAGLRRSDVVLVGLQHISGRVLSMTTAKTGARISVELSDELLRLINATPRNGLFLIESSIGKEFAKESFGNWFRVACNDAGITTKSAHGLRKLSATLAAEGGAATYQLLAQYGWSTVSTAEIYTKGVDRRRLGIEGSRIVADEIAKIGFPHPDTG